MFKWKDWDTPIKRGFTLQDDQNPYESCEPSWPVLLTCFKDPLCRLYMFALLQWSPSILLKTSLSRHATGKTRLTKVSGMRSLLVAPGGRWALRMGSSETPGSLEVILRLIAFAAFLFPFLLSSDDGGELLRSQWSEDFSVFFSGFVGLWGGSDGPICFTPFLYIDHSPYSLHIFIH